MVANLRKLRVKKGVSQQLLAESIGISQQSVNKYENHNIEPDIETLTAIADFFNTSVDYLIGHTEIDRVIETTERYELNEDEAEIVEEYRSLTNRQKESIRMLIQNFNK